MSCYSWKDVYIWVRYQDLDLNTMPSNYTTELSCRFAGSHSTICSEKKHAGYRACGSLHSVLFFDNNHHSLLSFS
ncbi:hypothetical protein Peur_031664 [Populus x canadensis]